MTISFFTIFRVFGKVSSWAEKALEDGKITTSEAADLAEGLGVILGLPTEIQVIPDIDKPVISDPARYRTSLSEIETDALDAEKDKHKKDEPITTHEPNTEKKEQGP